MTATAPAAHRPTSLPAQSLFARVEVFRDMAAVEPLWRDLQRVAVSTPYQAFDLLAAWQRHLGPASGVHPCVVAGLDSAGAAMCLLPLGQSRTGPLDVLSFLGGKHANFNFGLWRRDLAGRITAPDVRFLLGQIQAQTSADILTLLRQPCSWEGFDNPFLLLPHQPSPSQSVRLTIPATADELSSTLLSNTMRGRLRNKERKLQHAPGYRYLRATSEADVKRLLDAFFPLKAEHMQAQGLLNIFADPAHEAFLRESCQVGLATGTPLIEIHVLEADGELLALFAAVTDGRRSSGMFNTYTRSENARWSPGLILLVKIVGDLQERGMQVFDLGVGEASYKNFFCKDPEPLFDSFLPVTPLGKLAALATSAGGRVKRQIKQNNFLWNLVRTLRQGLAGRAG